jgi:hypothetical protein
MCESPIWNHITTLLRSERPTMNITLSVDERVAESAREAARKMGKSLNQAVRDYLEQLAGQERQATEWQLWEQRCLSGGGRLQGYKLDRDALHDRG